MIIQEDICCTVSTEISCDARRVFAFAADASRVGDWALGSFGPIHTDEQGVSKGISLFDRSPAWFTLDADESRLIVDYHIGSQEARYPRISVRVIPGDVLKKPASSCVLTMTAWRPADMDDLRWRRLCACHEAEVLMVKSQVESEQE